MRFGFVDPWHLFLPRETGHVVAFMGSGGKTTLMRACADLYRDLGLPTVLTTTTRCELLPQLPALTWAGLEAADPQALPPQLFVHGGLAAPDKWGGITAAQVDQLGGLLPERIVLVEVDGAAKRALKFYREGEPVWPGRTSLAVVVMGIAAVGGPVSAAVHRWGRVDFLPLAKLPEHALLEWGHLSELLLADGGYLAQVPAAVPAVLALTGMTEQDDSIGLFEFVGQAMDHPRLPLALFCELGPAGLTIRTACVERDDQAP